MLVASGSLLNVCFVKLNFNITITTLLYLINKISHKSNMNLLTFHMFQSWQTQGNNKSSTDHCTPKGNNDNDKITIYIGGGNMQSFKVFTSLNITGNVHLHKKCHFQNHNFE